MKRSFIREILEVIDTDTISFAGGLPDENLFPMQAIAASAQSVLSDPKSLQYSFSAGISALRDKLAAYYTALGLETSRENILITTGAQQALDLISRVYFKEGSVVEAPAYLGALNAFNANGCPLYPYALQNTEEFESLFAKTKRAYIMCDFQNPTGYSYSVEERIRIAQTAIRHEGIIVEDGAYTELYFEERLPMLSSFAPHHALHVGSFSKILAPGLRLGWIRGDASLLQPILALKERSDLHTSTLSQMVADTFWASGAFEEHLPKIRALYRAKCDYLADKLTTLLPEFVFEKPKGGMFIYGTFTGGIDAYALAMDSLKAGAVFVPGGEFYTATPLCSEARFNFTHSTFEEMERGVSIIAQTYKNTLIKR
ncbi:PLP-dependent aminotransferase family protein [Sulfuricurvum sp.]|uniref:aminotransferase-like domain-containing protein n=1 Tax=Sulfuricurvum sp. TaxID=2025608 RepID=UPI0026318FFD|nr:PLP-dependent aminotransferase family protein [Sulfuricurvum sp.]MDD2266112.1 PLP-dependent aminotransferase family protein [Sulfuricurvum sp.]MDD2783192.1 PLP-dependent aminotransferase family protein [Sulfuricurvum sp.]